MKFLKQNRFLLLLIFLVGAIAIPPFIERIALHDFIGTMFFSLILASGIYSFSKNLKFYKISSTFIILAIALEWIQFFKREDEIIQMAQVLYTGIVLIILLVETLSTVSRSKEVDLNTIFGAICGYVLIGFFGSMIAVFISLKYVDSYTLAGILTVNEAVYYSFVTMTTLGYGDISPVSPAARSFAVLLSILGPMYVAVLISILVGKFLSKSRD